MLRWLIRTGVSLNKKNKCQSESAASSRAAKDAIRKFDYAKRERDSQKQSSYLAEGLSKLAEAVEKNSNTVPPLAELAVAASVLTESIESGIDTQTKDIINKLSSKKNNDHEAINKLAKHIGKYEMQLTKALELFQKNNDLMLKILTEVSKKT